MSARMINRREFGQAMASAGGALLGSTLLGGWARPSPTEKTPVALQLYTVRDLIQADFTGTLKKVSKIGYDAVEFATHYGGLPPSQLKSILADLGLKCAGAHEGFDRLDKELDQVVAFHQSLGNTFITCPAIPQSWREKGADGYRQFGQRLNEIGAQIKKSGMQLCYHNHSFEFVKADGKYLLDILFEAADPGAVQAEIDVYWVTHAGEDPVSFIRKHAGRCPLFHIKDMKPGEKKEFAPVGRGIIKMKEVIQAAQASGAVWLIVEQDRTDGSPLEAIEISLKSMRRLLLKS
ncbi:MAG: sugar phosphate isomerase/epimerase [Acidobacteriota bacterium]